MYPERAGYKERDRTIGNRPLGNSDTRARARGRCNRPWRLANRYPGSVQLSAVTGEGLDDLRVRIAERFASRFVVVELLVPYAQGGKLAELYALGPPIELRDDRADGVFIRARLPEHELSRFAPLLVAEARRDDASSAAR